MSGTWQRIWAMVLRHSYLLRSSWPRLLELAYWPTFQLLLWGFITTFFLQHSSWIAQAAGVLISAVLLWDVLFRANLGLALTFLEEMWARNLGQLFISPLRPSELIASLMFISLIRTLISVTPAAFLALPLFDVWVFDLGLGLAAFFFNLMVMGWAIGLLVSGLLLRLGLGAESLCWLGIFLIAPITGIYYPVEVLPDWLEPVAWTLPSTYVFEGMRSVLFDQVFRWDLLAGAVCLNLLYLLLCSGVFLWMFRVARYQGKLLQQGE
ncbi:MAG: ABC transporter [Rhodospirillaceae bacterium]|nr:ABC transporter [Rhodospirillaceae bacterium]